jgi:MFS family permease
VVAGIALAALPTRVGFPVRLLVSAAGLFLLSLPLLRVGTLGGLVVVVLLLGFTVAPYMITTFTVGERIAPPARVGAAMTLLAAATGLGYAVGSALAGRLADLHGHTGAFAVTTTVTAAALLTAAAAYPLLGRAVLAAGVAKQPESPALAALSTSPDPRNRRP